MQSISNELHHEAESGGREELNTSTSRLHFVWAVISMALCTAMKTTMDACLKAPLSLTTN